MESDGFVESPAAATDPNQQRFLDAAYFVASLVGNLGTSFLSQLAQYKKAKDNSKGNARKTTSDFLAQLMGILENEKFEVGSLAPASYKFYEQATQAEREVAKLLPQGDGMFFTYNLYSALGYVLQAQLNKTKDAKMGSSEFIKSIINALKPIFALGEQQLKAPLRFAVTKKHAGEKKENLEALVQVVDQNFLPNFVPDFSIQQQLDTSEGTSRAKVIQDLFDYCAEKEDDSVSYGRPKKRVHVYEVFKAYFTAIKPEDFVKVFQEIEKGIQASRSEGGSGFDSRGAEFALITFRDQLFATLFNGYTPKLNFTVDQLNGILTSMSYAKLIEKEDADPELDSNVSQYAMTLVDVIERMSGKNQNAKRIEIIKRLVLEIPLKINGKAVELPERAKYCRSMGVNWAETITRLMEDTSLTEEERIEVAACGFVWNRYVYESGERSPQYFVPQIYAGWDEIRKYMDRSGFVFLKPIVEEFHKFVDSTFARAQMILAPRFRAALKTPEKPFAPVEGEESDIAMVERLIAKHGFKDAIALIKKNVLDIADSKHGGKRVDKAQVCVELGVRWARAITELLKTVELTEDREEIGVCGFIWNEYMLEKGVTDPFMYIPQHYVSCSRLREHALLDEKGFKPQKKNLEAAMGITLINKKQNTITAVQEIIASKTKTNLVKTLTGLNLDDELEGDEQDRTAVVQDHGDVPPPVPPADESSEGDVSLERPAPTAAILAASMAQVTRQSGAVSSSNDEEESASHDEKAQAAPERLSPSML